MNQTSESNSAAIIQRQGLPSGFMRVGPLMNLAALLRDLGCDADAVFANAGFSPAQLAEPDAEIPFVRASRIIEDCVTTTDCEHLGLLLGMRATPSSLGVAGYMVLAAPDAGSALLALVRNLDLHDRGAALSLTTKSSFTYFGYSIYLPGVRAVGAIYDISMTVACKIMRALCGENWSPHEVQLAHEAPRDTLPYRRFFRAPLRFGAHQSALVFESKWLEHKTESADSLLFHHLEKEALELHAIQGSDLLADLRMLIRKSLLVNQGAVPSIAAMLGMHQRTLNRKLHKQGTTFRKELESIRYELARQLLSNLKMPVSRIATAIGYADPTAFSRAFKSWSGVSPSEWRAARKKSIPGATS